MKKLYLSLMLSLSFYANSSAFVNSEQLKPHVFDSIEHNKSSINSNIERQSYSFNINNEINQFSIDIDKEGLKSRDLRLLRVVEGKDVFTLPEFTYNMELRRKKIESEVPGLTVTINYGTGGLITYQTKMTTKQNHEIIKSIINEAIQEEGHKIAKKYFHFVDSDIGSLFDYKYVAKNQQEIAEDIALNLNQVNDKMQGNKKDELESMLRFIQNIPYDQSGMKERYFRTPFAVLSDNLGDCDEKSLLLSMMLKEIMPNLESGILILPQLDIAHAVAYMEYPWPSANTVRIGSKNYMLLETTARLPFGVVEDKVSLSIQQGHFEKITI